MGKIKKILIFLMMFAVLFMFSGCFVSDCLGCSTESEKEEIIEIATVDGLLALKRDNQSCKLTSDIDLQGVEWEPFLYNGEFDGNGHKIKNLSIKDDNFDAENVGMFSILYGKIYNLTLENVDISVSGKKAKNVGALCGKMQQCGFVKDIVITGKISAEYADNVGGVCGVCESYFTNAQYESLTNEAEVIGKNYVGGIWGEFIFNAEKKSHYQFCEIKLTSLENKGKIKGTGDYVGGIAGSYSCMKDDADDHTKITTPKNSGEINGVKYIGGLFGNLECDSSSNSSLTGGINSGKIISSGGIVGGIVGRANSITIDTCDNDGTEFEVSGYLIDSSDRIAYVGGYVGYLFGKISDCKNNSDIIYSDKGEGGVGGICGYLECILNDNVITYSTLENSGKIEGNSNVGGIIGTISSGTKYTILNDSSALSLIDLKNTGNIKGTKDYVGGLLGRACNTGKYVSITVDLSENSGDISGATYVGGLVGSLESNANSCVRDCKSSGKITSTGGVAGGMAGKTESVLIDSCDNSNTVFEVSGKVSLSIGDVAVIGGYVGIGGGSFSDISNDMDISCSGASVIGGACGYLNAKTNITIESIENNGDITGAIVGGVVGYSESSATVELQQLKNNGTITSTGTAGGLFGSFMCKKLLAVELENNADITSTNYAGGIFGLAQYNTTDSEINDYSNIGNLTAPENGILYAKLWEKQSSLLDWIMNIFS